MCRLSVTSIKRLELYSHDDLSRVSQQTNQDMDCPSAANRQGPLWPQHQRSPQSLPPQCGSGDRAMAFSDPRLDIGPLGRAITKKPTWTKYTGFARRRLWRMGRSCLGGRPRSGRLRVRRGLPSCTHAGDWQGKQSRKEVRFITKDLPFVCLSLNNYLGRSKLHQKF